MGTNYYAQMSTGECECCHRPGETVHLGKLSGGWVPTVRLMSLDETVVDWQNRVWAAERLFNEYGDELTPLDLIAKFEGWYPKGRSSATEPPTRWSHYGKDREKVLSNGWDGYVGDFL